MKTFFWLKMFIFTLILTGTATASGNREIAINESSVTRAGKLTVNDLSRDYHYLASTSQWHLFGQVLTSVDNGMPFDNVYLYKIDKQKLLVKGSWLVTPKKGGLYAFVRNCPPAILAKRQSKIVLTVKAQSKDHCIYVDK